MSSLYKYLYAVSAGCFIGVGSGLITFMPYLFDREAEAIAVVTSYEQRTETEFNEGFECTIGQEHYAECQYANYLASSNSSLVSFCQKLAYCLVGFGALSAALGFHFHRRDAESDHSTQRS